MCQHCRHNSWEESQKRLHAIRIAQRRKSAGLLRNLLANLSHALAVPSFFWHVPWLNTVLARRVAAAENALLLFRDQDPRGFTMALEDLARIKEPLVRELRAFLPPTQQGE